MMQKIILLKKFFKNLLYYIWPLKAVIVMSYENLRSQAFLLNSTVDIHNIYLFLLLTLALPLKNFY